MCLCVYVYLCDTVYIVYLLYQVTSGVANMSRYVKRR